MWVQFQRADGQKAVYMSNGGQLSNGHGIAMSYSSSGLEFVFKTKSGKEWRVAHREVLPGKWYHVAASWSADKGKQLLLILYTVQSHYFFCNTAYVQVKTVLFSF